MQLIMSLSKNSGALRGQGRWFGPTLLLILVMCLAVQLGVADLNAGSVRSGQERNALPEGPAAGVKVLQINPIPEPEADGQKGQRFLVEALRITNAKRFSVAELQIQLKNFIHQTLSIKGLNSTTAFITGYYRAHGYFVANTWASWSLADAPKHASYRLNGVGMGLSWWGGSSTLSDQTTIAHALEGNPVRGTRGNNADGSKSKTRLWLPLARYF